ncbi:unnamed protein product [Amoebophrya sp. A25]|nr:unnamed protein product [Amoebophrya sp. A25]|eukprot:GSA25T00009972001.1
MVFSYFRLLFLLVRSVSGNSSLFGGAASVFPTPASSGLNTAGGGQLPPLGTTSKSIVGTSTPFGGGATGGLAAPNPGPAQGEEDEAASLVPTKEWLRAKFANLQGSLATLFPFHPDIFLRSIFDDRPTHIEFVQRQVEHEQKADGSSTSLGGEEDDEETAALLASTRGRSTGRPTGGIPGEGSIGSSSVLVALRNPDPGTDVGPGSRSCVVVDVATADSREMHMQAVDGFTKLKLWSLKELLEGASNADLTKSGEETEKGDSTTALVDDDESKVLSASHAENENNKRTENWYTEATSLRVLWLHGKGKTLDPWLGLASQLCAHYDILVMEDELLIVAFREKTKTLECKLVPFDANEVEDMDAFHSLPWRPDEILPVQLEGIPLVSFHAHRVFDKEAQRNHHKWLADPDTWTPFFLDMVRQGWVVMCLEKDQCQNDRMPFRLIFTEEIGEEFIECLSNGIIPIYYLSANLASYLERVLLFMPFYFTTPQEMHHVVNTITDGNGILTQGVRMYMTHESNHYLTALYWGQSRFLRFLTALTAMHNQEVSVVQSRTLGLPGSNTAELASGMSLTGELLVCVHSARKNRRARDLIRRTWARGSRYPAIEIRVVFFLGHSSELEEEQAEHGDLVLLHHLDDKFENIWVKTAAIMKFGMLHFREPKTGTRLRYLMKADDDTFFNIDGMVEDLFAPYTGRRTSSAQRSHTNFTALLPDGRQDPDWYEKSEEEQVRDIKPTIEIQTVDIGNYETSKHLHTGHYWGFIMALVQPNRNTSDKYYVPYRSFGNEFYPAYARGLGYAMSEDLVVAVGQSLADGSITPFPYREDVSVGLYLYSLAKMGRAKVRPMQRKDHMPLQIDLYCSEVYDPRGPKNMDLLEIHRYGYENHDCLWNLVLKRREAGFPTFEPKNKFVPLEFDFCQCFI